jgi:2-polyprenyl-3-methyl-5-hydroxy-6-metoxy-1,4-benzoquinol methylase
MARVATSLPSGVWPRSGVGGLGGMDEPRSIAKITLVCPRCRAPFSYQAEEVECRNCRARFAHEDGILRLVSGANAAPGFDPHYFPLLSQVEQEHFWFVVRREVILDALARAVPDLRSRPLFDIGCGSGGLLAFLAEAGIPVAGACDAYLEGLQIARQRIDRPFLLVDEGRLPPLGPGQPMIGMFDVLEHMDDDQGTLDWAASVLEPGGVLVLTVPAHPFLFDEMDELAHHRRRYRREELREKLERAGLQIQFISHFMATLVPTLMMLRWLGRRIRGGRNAVVERRSAELSVVPVLNDLLRTLLRLERYWLRLLPLPFGSSLVAIATRPAAR